MTTAKRASNNPAGRPRSDQVTERIHAAVFAILEKASYGDLSMEAIAEHAQVSRPALYRRYANVGQTTLGALQATGPVILPMPDSGDIGKDLRSYFTSLVASIKEASVIGRALRGALAAALTDATLGPDFARFIHARQEPVRQRLLEWNSVLDDAQLDAAMDSIFGPILYRLLIRRVGTTGHQIRGIIERGLKMIISGESE
jgi:AcrR family transcriptional regulator